MSWQAEHTAMMSWQAEHTATGKHSERNAQRINFKFLKSPRSQWSYFSVWEANCLLRRAHPNHSLVMEIRSENLKISAENHISMVASSRTTVQLDYLKLEKSRVISTLSNKCMNYWCSTSCSWAHAFNLCIWTHTAWIFHHRGKISSLRFSPFRTFNAGKKSLPTEQHFPKVQWVVFPSWICFEPLQLQQKARLCNPVSQNSELNCGHQCVCWNLTLYWRCRGGGEL